MQEETINIPVDIVDNIIYDFKKKEINPFLRAKMLIDYRKAKGLSQRGLGKKFGIPHSTIQDYERISVITQEEYTQMKEEQGLNDTDIYRQLRNNINVEKKVYIYKTVIDIMLENFIKELRAAIHTKLFSKDTPNLVRTAKNELNRLEMYVDKH